MLTLVDLAMTVTPSPGGGEPELRPGLDPEQVTPGTLGFLATLFVAVVTIFLIRDMTRRIRRVRYQAQLEEQEIRAAGGQEQPQGAGDAGTPQEPGSRGPDNPGPDNPGGSGQEYDGGGRPGTRGTS